jgi:hypothetical protein
MARKTSTRVCTLFHLGNTGSLDDLMQLQGTASNNLPVDTGHDTGGSNKEPLKMRMIGDFDDAANALWDLYGKEAKSHDQSRIQTLKDDMDGVLIFVRSSYSPNHTHSPPHRLVCSLHHSPRSSSIAFRTYSQALLNKQRTTCNKMSHCSHRSLNRFLPSPHKLLFLPHLLPPSQLSNHCHLTSV